MKRVEIAIATHKPYAMPKEKSYLPLQVGAALHEDLGFTRDDSGDNISKKNPSFCELTGLYFLWKNSDAKFKGLVHYRRHFTLKKGIIRKKNRMKSVLSDAEMTALIKEYDLILPKKRNYYIETLWKHYEHTLHVEPLEKTREIIAKDSPEYLKEFDRLKSRKSAHMFNMMIAKKELFDEYCDWLFQILAKLEKEMKKSNSPDLSAFHQRFYGRISELLFDVWLKTKHKDLKVKELRVLDIEGVNWLKKGGSFILSKFTGRKYEKSF